MIKRLVILCVGFLGVCGVSGEIPTYFKLCKRNHPDLSKCIRNSIEYLRPKLKEGIPELNIPSIEPLPLSEIRLNSGSNQARINTNISNLVVHGPSSFKINDLKADLNRTRFLAQFTIPTLYFEGNYDLDMSVLFIKYKGQGPIYGNFTDYVFNCLMKADKIQRDNKIFLQFRKFTLTLQTGKSYLHLENLFGEDGAVLAQASRDLIQENTEVFIDEIRPTLERSLAEKFTNIANSIMNKYSYDELFPQ